MSKIDIGIKIDLPKFLESRLLIEADSGAGKSWALRKFGEECSGKVQQIFIDPEGDFITLREKYPFALVSKSGGDIPLNLRYAEALAHKLLETRISAVIDLYEFKQNEREQFVKVFCESLINAPKSLRHSCIIYFDEAHMFAPEDNRAISTHAVVDMCTRGRKRGLCPVMATHRISSFNKNAAAQCKNKLIGSTSLDIDQKRAGSELGLSNKEDIRNLRNLDAGEFYAFGPAISKEILKFKVADVQTTHIKSGSKLSSLPPTPVAIKKILSKLESLPEEAEKDLNTKKELMAEVKRLTIELKKKPTVEIDKKGFQKGLSVKDAEELTKKALQPYITQLKQWKDYSIQVVKFYQNIIMTYQRKLSQIGKLLDELAKTGIELNIPAPEDIKMPKISVALPILNVHSIQPKKIISQPISKTTTASSSNGIITGGEKLILIACASYPNGLRRDQLIVITGYKKTSRDIFISKLKQAGYLEQAGEKLVATDAGIDVLGDNYQPLPKGQELQDYWMGKLGGGEKEILKALIDAYPNSVTRDDLITQTSYKKTSRDIFISKLSARELLIIPAKGEVRASDELFN